MNGLDTMAINADSQVSWLDGYADEVQTYAEEITNAITHGMGVLLSIPATIILVSLAKHHGNKWHVIGCTLYGLSLITMYTCSTMYHWSGVSVLKDFQAKLRDLDHCAIYFLIAGTYTPITLVNLVHDCMNPAANKIIKEQRLSRNNVIMGCALLTVVWTICVVGVTSKLVAGADGVHPVLNYGSYLIMGWLSIVVAKPMLFKLPRTGLRLLIAGGLSYSLGVIFLLSDSVPFNHPVWHLFVAAGSIFHYFSVIACSIPIDTTPWKMMEKRTRSVVLDWSTRFAITNLVG